MIRPSQGGRAGESSHIVWVIRFASSPAVGLFPRVIVRSFVSCLSLRDKLQDLLQSSSRSGRVLGFATVARNIATCCLCDMTILILGGQTCCRETTDMRTQSCASYLCRVGHATRNIEYTYLLIMVSDLWLMVWYLVTFLG